MAYNPLAHLTQEASPTGRYLDSKAGISSQNDYNTLPAEPDYSLFDDLDND